MGIRRLAGDDWELYRDIRLAALIDSPGAFASTHERESGFDEAMWRRRITIGPDGREIATFVDIDGEGIPAGTAAVVFTEHHPAPMLVAMWVCPEARRTGSGRRLIDACVEWARSRGEGEIVLWVVRDNEPAVRLYEQFGFRPTGKTDTLPSDPGAEELEMLLEIR